MSSGYKTITPIQLANVLWALHQRLIGKHGLRVYWAAFVLVAVREAAARSRCKRREKPREFHQYRQRELERLTELDIADVRRALRELERAGLAIFAEGEITLRREPLSGSEALLGEIKGGRSEEKLSHGQAHQVAKSQVLGVQWQRARHSLKQATQNALSARGHLQRLSIERQVVRERSRSGTFWLVKAPYLAWKARPIKRRLREAVHQRRSALKVIRVLRPAAADPLIGARISALTEVLLINDERLSHSIQNLQSADQAVSLQISEALRLAPQLRALGEAQVTMEQKLDPVAQRHSLPKPLQTLESVTPLPTRKPGMRIR